MPKVDLQPAQFSALRVTIAQTRYVFFDGYNNISASLRMLHYRPAAEMPGLRPGNLSSTAAIY